MPSSTPSATCPATFLQASFQMMKPVQNYYSKYITFFDKMDDDRFIENYFAMEKWTNDNIPVAGETFREFVKKLYQRNELAKGEFTLDNQPVDLKKITCPVQILMASADHLVPPVPERGPQVPRRLEGRQVQHARRRPHRPLGQLQGPQEVLARGDPVAGRPLEPGQLLKRLTPFARKDSPQRTRRARRGKKGMTPRFHGFKIQSDPDSIPDSHPRLNAVSLESTAIKRPWAGSLDSR